MHRQSVMLALAAVTSVGIGVSQASASAITITNPSFETPAITPPGSWTSAPSEWHASSGDLGVLNTSYSGAPTPPDGTQWLYAHAYDTNTTYSAYQNVNSSIVASQKYTLTLTIGKLPTTLSNFTVGLYTDDGVTHKPTVQLAAAQNGDVAIDVNSHTGLATVEYNSDGTYAGRDLYVYLAATTAGGDTRVLFDNVSLTQVPEPTSIALVMGLGGLAILSRRKRPA